LFLALQTYVPASEEEIAANCNQGEGGSGGDSYPPTEEVLTTLGSHGDLRCSLDGDNLVWKRENGEPVPNKAIKSGQILRILNVDQSDEGRYMCTDDSGSIQYIKLTLESHTNSAYQMGSDSSVKREIVIKPSKNTAYIGQNFELKCHVTTLRNQLRRQPRYYGGASGYTKWSKVDGYISPNVKNFGGNTIRFNRLRKENSGTYRCQVDLSLMNGGSPDEPKILQKDFALTVVGDNPDDYILV
jgi:hypothetical protein